MNTRKPIFWYQGQFLQPQHFQYTDLHQSSLLHPMQRIASPFYWGVITLDYNKNALSSDIFEVRSGEFLFKDGTLANYPEDATLASRSFTSAWVDRHKPFTVYLGIRKMDMKGANVTLVPDLNTSDVASRFVSSTDVVDIPDLHHEGPSGQMKTLTKVLRLFWESEIEEAQDYELLPIAQIKTDADLIVPSTEFVPPCLQLSSSANLLRLLVSLRDEISGRTRQLEEYKIPIGMQGYESDARSIPYRFALQMLSHHVPLLSHYINTPAIHPWQIYGYLLQLLGGISTLSDQVNCLGIASDGKELVIPYQHESLGECFKKAVQLIVQLLNNITISTEMITEMPRDPESGHFKAELQPSFFKSQDIYLALNTEQPFEKLLDSFLQFVKIGSSEQIKFYAEHSLSGLNVILMKIHPEGVPRRPNTSYFKVDRRDEAWNDIQLNKTIEMIWDDAPEDLKVELIAVRR